MAKNCVVFSLRSKDKLPTTLAQIRKWNEVKAAGILFPDSSDAELQRMGFADLDDEANAQDVVDRVASRPDVENASLAAARRLT